MINHIFKLAEFDKDFGKLDKSEQYRIEKILEQLHERADVGKPLGGLPFFREKRFDGKRLYFLIYDKLNVILIIGISDKKMQKATINQILLNMTEYHQYVINLLKE